ncbi:MAG: 50S ribosomal protein L23 [Proteobacteria bacterium]|jgi:large subunit ribosomal protein L23|uniref:Large ribosomal subunit protein uL23 n=6 Tax=Pseudomonadota TaxID=1224 RepID=A0A3S8ZU47_9NEIS|nr:50S ribosomal protein L23 [Janthinobacterium sp. B9-8]AZN37037.1 50S ribosomal protein L23 [Iodobacter ciconiae]MCX7205215.1 50S ribosomal protein L23 [Pseudomonadota bacterium]NHQ88288.1 50S ribosomal protein L23 [Iodobacter violacea]PHV03336.1 50S ribosomal protein L23 [Iodobacter sp. BJB302]QBC43260.1 50S ribosomal protein L23 [Iodobacter fluviatilis]
MMQFSENRLLQVLLAPIVSEKTTFVAEKNDQVVFRVSTDATKAEIKAAVELLFKVKVEGVSTLNVKGKGKKFGRTVGRRKDWKKAYISLAAGQELDLAAAQ